MLQVSNLGRSYGSFVAVEGVDFSIGKGEIVGLLGHNGAGKTTIMKMLSGYLEPNQGNVLIGDIDLAEHPHQIQSSLGYLPECLPVYPEMLVADYLDYAAELKGLQGEGKRDEIRRVVAATDIGAKLLSPIATLSRGYKQRVGVAQALLGRPRLLILDEPTNGLDPTQTEQMRQLIKEISLEATVVLSTHIMQEVAAICDRVLILRDGRLAVDERLEDLQHSNHLLLHTSLAPSELRAALAAITDLNAIDEQDNDNGPAQGYHYRLTLNDGQQRRPIAAAIASAIVTGGAALYQLHTEHRDLETLFREVSEAPAANATREVIDHAA